VTRPHLEQSAGAKSVSLNGRSFINLGLVGTGRLAAGTTDFLGDTLGSFSSLQIAPGSWKRVGDHYEARLWTLPDRGRNDPAARLFYDYAARLERFRVRFTPQNGRFDLRPDGGLILRDFDGKPFTGADPDTGTTMQRGLLLPAPMAGVGAGKLSLDAESLQFAKDGSFYIGDEYTTNIYYFDPRGRLRGVIQPPQAIVPRRGKQVFFGSVETPDTGRRNNQGVEGMSLSPDGHTLFVTLQSALIQDSAGANAAGRTTIRVLTYDVRRSPTPAQPVGHYVMQLPAYNAAGDGGAPDRTAAQSEIRAIDGHSFLMLARDNAGLGADNANPIVCKSILVVDIADATNLVGTRYEIGTTSVLEAVNETILRTNILPVRWSELINMLNSAQLADIGLRLKDLSEKWEAMDLVSSLEPDHPMDHFLIVGNNNDFIAKNCRMSDSGCGSDIDNDNRLLIYRIRFPDAGGHM
jgi:hypothetical protein